MKKNKNTNTYKNFYTFLNFDKVLDCSFDGSAAGYSRWHIYSDIYPALPSKVKNTHGVVFTAPAIGACFLLTFTHFNTVWCPYVPSPFFKTTFVDTVYLYYKLSMK